MKRLFLILPLLCAVAVLATPPSVLMRQMVKPASAPPATKNFVRVTNLDGSGHDYAYAYPGTSVTINPTAGGTIVVFASGQPGASSMSVSDGVNTYHQAVFGTSANNDVGCCIATNVSGSSVTISVTMTGASDVGITVVEYTGASQFDVADGASATGTPSIALNTTSTDMVLCYWANESTDTPGTLVLDAGSVAAGVVHHGTGHYDELVEWLGGSSGFASGTWTVNGTGGHASSQYVAVALK